MTILVQPEMISSTAPWGPGSITGLLPSAIGGTNTTAAVTVSIGAAVDSTNARLLTLANAYNWSVANGFQGGTTLPNNSTIHFFLCAGASGVIVWGHTGLVPAAPAGYTNWYRRVFSLITNASGAPLPGITFEILGGGVRFYLTTPVLDFSSTTLGTTRVLSSLSVPSGIRCLPLLRQSSNTQANVQLLCPDEAE